MNLTTAAVALIVGAGNSTLTWADYQFAGIALGTLGAIAIYQVLRAVRRTAGGGGTPVPLAATPEDAPPPYAATATTARRDPA